MIKTTITQKLSENYPKNSSERKANENTIRKLSPSASRRQELDLSGNLGSRAQRPASPTTPRTSWPLPDPRTFPGSKATTKTTTRRRSTTARPYWRPSRQRRRVPKRRSRRWLRGLPAEGWGSPTSSDVGHVAARPSREILSPYPWTSTPGGRGGGRRPWLERLVSSSSCSFLLRSLLTDLRKEYNLSILSHSQQYTQNILLLPLVYRMRGRDVDGTDWLSI